MTDCKRHSPTPRSVSFFEPDACVSSVEPNARFSDQIPAATPKQFLHSDATDTVYYSMATPCTPCSLPEASVICEGDPSLDFDGENVDRQSTLHRVIANLNERIVEMTVTVNESHHHAISLADQLAQETEMRKVSDDALRSIVERLESEVLQLWQGLRTETKSREDVVQNLEEAKHAIDAVSAGFETFVAKGNDEAHVHFSRDCSVLQARAKEMAAEPLRAVTQEGKQFGLRPDELSLFLDATCKEFRVEFCEEATSEISELVGAAEAELRVCCEGEISRLSETRDSATAGVQEEIEAWHKGIFGELETVESMLKKGIHTMNRLEEESVCEHTAFKLECARLHDFHEDFSQTVESLQASRSADEVFWCGLWGRR